MGSSDGIGLGRLLGDTPFSAPADATSVSLTATSEWLDALVAAAVRSGLFPPYEVFDGERYRSNRRPDGRDVSEYLGRQRRYSAANVEHVRERIAALPLARLGHKALRLLSPTAP